jgi:hypothetical protein
MNFGQRFDALLVEEGHKYLLNQRVKLSRHSLRVEDAIHVFAIRFFGAAEVVLDSDCCRGVHELSFIVSLEVPRRARRAKMVLTWQ